MKLTACDDVPRHRGHCEEPRDAARNWQNWDFVNARVFSKGVSNFVPRNPYMGTDVRNVRRLGERKVIRPKAFE